MCKQISRLLTFVIFLIPVSAWSQTPTAKPDSLVISKDAVATTPPVAPVETVKVVVDTVVKKDCYTEFYDAMRARGAKPVPNGKQDVVIALKSPEGCNCFMGQVEVVDGKIKPPVYVQQENGEYKSFAAMGKKIEPFFALSLTAEELTQIKDGMSIAFKTADNEQGRIFFYKYANKSSFKYKAAPSVTDLITD